MQVSRSAYYSWRSNERPLKEPDVALKAKLKALFEASKSTYGSRRLSRSLTEAGFPVGRYKVRRLMEEMKLIARYPKRFRVTTDSNHSFELAPNRLNRQFSVGAPNKAWTTDITYGVPGAQGEYGYSNELQIYLKYLVRAQGAIVLSWICVWLCKHLSLERQ